MEKVKYKKKTQKPVSTFAVQRRQKTNDKSNQPCTGQSITAGASSITEKNHIYKLLAGYRYVIIPVYSLCGVAFPPEYATMNNPGTV